MRTAVLGADRPANAREVGDLVQAVTTARVHMSAVFLVLNGLLADGEISRVELTSSYRAPLRPDEFLLVCRTCGRIETRFLPGQSAHLAELAASAGFIAGRHVVELAGECGGCRSK